MKNIAILVHALKNGGAERVAGYLSEYLCHQYNVYIFLYGDLDIVYSYGGKIIDLTGLSINALIKEVIRVKREYRIDCTISFLLGGDLINILTRTQDVIIVSERNTTQYTYPLNTRKYANVVNYYRYADKVVAVSNGAAKLFVQHYHLDNIPIETIYNFIDKEEVLHLSYAELDDGIIQFIGKSKLIINIGRIERQKNQIKLVVQFAKLVESGEDVKLIIVGTGSMHSEITHLIEKMNLASRVMIISYQNNSFPFYKIASVFVLSSEWEGLPNVLLEAMLLGVPIVAVDCLSGPRELLKGMDDYSNVIHGYEICKNGILVENTTTDTMGTTSFLKDAIELLIKNDEIRESIIKNALNYMELYNNKKILQQWIDVIENTSLTNMEKHVSLLECLKTKNEIIIYGAGGVGKKVMRYLLDHKEQYNYNSLCFAVTQKSDTDNEILNQAVYEITELISRRKEAIVVIAVGEKYENEMVKIVNELKFKYVFADIFIM